MTLHSDAWRNISFALLGATFAFGGLTVFGGHDNADDPTLVGQISEAVAPQAHAAEAGGFGLGREATPEEVAAWDIDVRPDGLGLPEGSGDVFTGEEVFAEKCATCHGDFGEAVGRWPVLAGGSGTLSSADPVKTVGSYWPYLSTAWDYVHRAMPFGEAQSLTDDEVYSIVAYILYVNDLVDDEFELSKENFAEVRLPNEEHFFMDDRDEAEASLWKDNVCMKDCKETVEITSRARVLQVTPDDGTQPAGGEQMEGHGDAQEDAEVVEAAVQTAEAAPVALDPELVKSGSKVFRKCKSCHQIGDGAKHRTGPILNGVFGRAAGTADGFSKYSSAMTAAGDGGLVWSDETLAAFLAKPKDYVDGTSMAFAGLKKEKDVAALLAYLRSEGGE